MSTDCTVSVAGKPAIYRFVLLGLLFCLIAPFTAGAGVVDVTTHIDNTNATPFQIWEVMALAGPILILMTLKSRLQPAELEADFIVSVAAWIPIAFTAYSSFAVDRIVSSFMTSDGGIVENHIIYHFDIFGFGYGILLLVAILNTIRIIILHNKLQFTPESGRGW
jgi:hypothetical protein